MRQLTHDRHGRTFVDVLDATPAEKRRLVFDLVTARPGRIFGVSFVKRTTGELRDMQAQYNGTKSNDPAVLYKFDHTDRGLLPVLDVALRQARRVNVDGVVELRLDGRTYRFDAMQAEPGPALPVKRRSRGDRRRLAKAAQTSVTGTLGMTLAEISAQFEF